MKVLIFSLFHQSMRCVKLFALFVAKSGRKFVVATSKFFKLVSNKRFLLADFIWFIGEKTAPTYT